MPAFKQLVWDMWNLIHDYDHIRLIMLTHIDYDPTCTFMEKKFGKKLTLYPKKKYNAMYTFIG